MTVGVVVSGPEMSKRWPHIKRFLRVESSGDVEDDFHWWWSAENTLSPAERTAANEEWADFYEWRFEQRADELAGDHHKRGLIEEWTDSMAYMCRRCAAFARGDDPGPWVPQWERRPDLAAAKRARVDEIIADLNAQQSAEAPDQYLRKVG